MAEFRQWKMEFESNDAGLVDRSHVPDPPGFDPSIGREVVVAAPAAGRRGGNLAVKQQALYGLATGQVKQIGFMAFMMYMSGSQIHLFSIMMTVSGIYQPLMAILKSGEVFPSELSEEGKLDIVLPRLLYILIQAGGLAFGLYKLHGLGLLPTHASDFVSAMSVPKPIQSSAQAIPLVL